MCYEQLQITFGLKKFKFFVPSFCFRYSPKKLITNRFCFSSDEEKFTVTSVKSPHDVESFKGLQLKYNLSTFETVQLINGSSVKPSVIKSKLPWHVIGTVTFVIDSDSLKTASILVLMLGGGKYIKLKHHPQPI